MCHCPSFLPNISIEYVHVCVTVHKTCVLNLVQYSTSTALNLYIVQGDEADLAKKIATLKWHEKEMEVRVHVYAFVIVFACK